MEDKPGYFAFNAQYRYLGLPAIEGYTLITVVCHNVKLTTTTPKIGITTLINPSAAHPSNDAYVSGGAVQEWNAEGGETYTYKTDGATTLLAHWELCPDGTISVNNECKPCTCNEGAGVVSGSCSTQSTDANTCAGTAECVDGYISPNVTCDGPTCNATCNACESNQISIDGACETCACTVGEGALSCGDVPPVVNNTCKHDPTCKPGYAYPNLVCNEIQTECGITCTQCPAGTYQDGEVCTPCPTGYTSLPGATSVRECFVDPNSCAEDEHIEHGVCTPNVKACSVPDAPGTGAVRIWNPAIGTYGPCIVNECNNGYHVSGNACVKNTEACTVEHGHGDRQWTGTAWGACGNVICDPGYEPNSGYTACVECYNRRVNGEVAVSGYIYECEIAACMYQGQKYALQNNECVPICENASDETGTKVWDERTKKCIRTCNPGYKMW